MRKWKYIIITCAIGINSTTIYAQSYIEDTKVKSIDTISKVADSTNELPTKTEEDLSEQVIKEDLSEQEKEDKGNISEKEIEEGKEDVSEEVVEEIDKLEYLSRKDFNEILLQNSLERLVYLDTDKNPSIEEVSYALCKIIDEEGIYLPEEESINPYLAKLMILGIYQEDYIETESGIKIEVWTKIYDNTILYNSNRKPIKYADVKKQNKMNIYYNKLKKANIYEDVNIGEISLSKYILKDGTYTYPLYTLKNTNYIDASTLTSLGYTIENSDQGYIIKLSNEANKMKDNDKKSARQVKLLDKCVYVNDVKSYIISGNNRIFVPVRILESDYNLAIQDKTIDIYRKNQNDRCIEYVGGNLVNTGVENTKVEFTNYYWNGKEIIEEKLTKELSANQTLGEFSELEKIRKGKYLTTIINKVENINCHIEYTSRYGQDMKDLLKHYEKCVEYEENGFDETFPGGAIMGTIRYNINGLKKGNKVEVHMQGGGYYTVITDKGNKVRVPGGSLNIERQTRVNAKPVTKEQVEMFINTKNISSDTSYLVWTEIYRQITYVFKGEKNNWQLVKRMPSSSGANVTPTPRGFFKLGAKVPSFGQSKGYCCKNAMGFIGTTYLYHSILFDATGTYIISDRGELGKEKGSQGCIRVSPENSYWMYNTIPLGTKVWID